MTKIGQWTALRKRFKTEIYRLAKLKPRTTDIDFAPGEGLDHDDALQNRQLALTTSASSREPVLSQFASLAHVAEDILATIKKDAMLSIPISARVSAAQSVNACMLATLSVATGKGGFFAYQTEAHQPLFMLLLVVVVW